MESHSYIDSKNYFFEDRIYTAFHSSDPKFKLKCSDWKDLNHNDWHQSFEVYISKGGRGALYSTHPNDYEDRMFHIKICKLVHKCSEIVHHIFHWNKKQTWVKY